MTNRLPGVFRPLSHHVPDGTKAIQLDGHYAHQLGLAGQWALIATCGAPCWPQHSTQPTTPLAWCPQCQLATLTIWPPDPDQPNAPQPTLTNSA